MTDEFERIEKLRRRFASASSEVALGIGDDAAILTGDSRPQVLSVDVAVEGVHFRRELLSWHDLGYRAMAAALSDLAAMGASPRAALCSLILPEDVDDDALEAVGTGLAQAAARHGAAVVGGNLAGGGELSLTTTVVGSAPASPLTRQGARDGHALYVTGELGSAALGLALLTRPHESDPADAHFVERWRRPLARIDEGRALSESGASAAIDVSDGLLQDLEHLCRASGVAAELERTSLPLAPELAARAALLGLEPLDLALSGGEDYELLYAAAEGSRAAAIGTRIGRFTAGEGLTLLDGGVPRPVPARRGYRHF